MAFLASWVGGLVAVVVLAGVAGPAMAQAPLCPDGQRSNFGKCPTLPRQPAPQVVVEPSRPPVVRTTGCNASRASGGGGAPGCPPVVPPPVPLPPAPSAGSVIRDCPDCPEIVLIPAGSFDMGMPASEAGRYDDEGPVHRVTIGQSFYLGKYHVTRGQYGAFARATGRNVEDPFFPQTDDHPVVEVSWNDAVAYAAWLSQRTRQRYRLPTEAEWEYAARAGTRTAYYWGDQIGRGNADCDGCGSQWDDKQTAPVGSFRPNAFGLYDMAGNAWQWVQDCYVDYNSAPRDGYAYETDSCSSRMLRGGSWRSIPGSLRAGNRNALGPGVRYVYNGFRVARTLTP